MPGARGKARKPPGPWADLPPDVLQVVALLLSQQDRFKLNLVCRGWRDGLDNAAWADVTVDPRRKTSTSRRVRFKKHLPTPESLGAWFQRRGAHVRRLCLRNLDAAAEAEGCAGAADVAQLLHAAAGGLCQLTFHHCSVTPLLAHHADVMQSLQRLTSLHFQLPPDGSLSLASALAAFITRLTSLVDLGLATGYGGIHARHVLPASLAALPQLRSLQLARLPPAGERGGAVDLSTWAVFDLHVASSLAGLTALEKLVVRNFFMRCEQWVLVAQQDLPPTSWLPRALLTLPRISTLHLVDVGLGLQPSPLPAAASAVLAMTGLCPLPPGFAALAGRLRELALLEHTCAPGELAVLSALTGLTSLSLSYKVRHACEVAVPDAVGQLTSLVHLKLSHGLKQVPYAITQLPRLTFLDLSYNRLHSLKPGPYLKQLVAVNLRANAFVRFPQQLRVARRTARELQLPQNDCMALKDADVDQLLTFERLRVLVLFGASEDRETQRNLAALQRAMPWVQVDV